MQELSFAGEDSQPTVQTQYGKLRGISFKTILSPTPVYAFRGIRYAKPPVGDLRLALAQPVESWEGVMDATQPGICSRAHILCERFCWICSVQCYEL